MARFGNDSICRSMTSHWKGDQNFRKPTCAADSHVATTCRDSLTREENTRRLLLGEHFQYNPSASERENVTVRQKPNHRLDFLAPASLASLGTSATSEEKI
jgi:hypothetical protein